MPASLGRDFSFAVQSIGMTSASIFILARRQPLAWSMLQGAMLGRAARHAARHLLLAPLLPELWIKLVFAVAWASFGVLHLYRIGEIAAHEGMTEFDERWDFRVGLGIGVLRRHGRGRHRRRHRHGPLRGAGAAVPRRPQDRHPHLGDR
jgi:uncharacterized protein